MINLAITPDIIKKANDFSKKRMKEKEILKKNNLCFDKFTVTDRDSFDGFIAEETAYNFLKKNFDMEVIKWSSINSIDQELANKIDHYPNKKISAEELNRLRIHFYDRWDIKMGSKYIDIKSASTHLTPTKNWTYGIPKIQIEKDGKSHIILNYLIYDKDPKINSDAKPIKCVLVGFLTLEYIKNNCPVSNNNQFGGHTYKIANYETKIADYMDLKQGFDKI
jgi:hypothetical protein